VSHELDRVIDGARAIMREGRRGVLVTLLRTSGSTYRRAGARAVIAEDGVACGLVSGGCIERDLALRMREWLIAGGLGVRGSELGVGDVSRDRLFQNPRAPNREPASHEWDFAPRVVTYDSTTDADLIFGSGLGCRGTLELFIEPFDASRPPAIDAFRRNGREPVVWTTRLGDRELLVEIIRPPRSIAVFGNGGDVAPLATLCEHLGWNVSRFTASARNIDASSFDAAVVMTHNFLHDAELLDLLLPSAIPYVGVLGPKKRGEELLAHVSDAARAHAGRLHSPIGLDLGGDTPEEIALSIAAEIQAVLNGRDARALHDRDAPIHAPEQTWA
jgi:xanthine dehydrogenase accessory factor